MSPDLQEFSPRPSRTSLRAGLAGLSLAALTAGVALAQAPAAPPVPNKGGVAFMMSWTILVLLMTCLLYTSRCV